MAKNPQKFPFIKQKFIINYLKYKEFLKNKNSFYYQKILRFSNKIGRIQILRAYRYLKPITKILFFKIFKIFLEGSFIYIALLGILEPVNVIHQIFAYGLSLYITSKILNRLWSNYIKGKKEIQGEIIEEKQEEMINDMG